MQGPVKAGWGPVKRLSSQDVPGGGRISAAKAGGKKLGGQRVSGWARSGCSTGEECQISAKEISKSTHLAGDTVMAGRLWLMRENGGIGERSPSSTRRSMTKNCGPDPMTSRAEMSCKFRRLIDCKQRPASRRGAPGHLGARHPPLRPSVAVPHQCRKA